MREPLLAVRRAGLVACTALVLALTACSAPAADPGSLGTAPGADAPATGLDFSGTTIDGDRFEAAALAGSPVVLWFWAPY